MGKAVEEEGWEQILEAVCLGSDPCSTTKELWTVGQVTHSVPQFPSQESRDDNNRMAVKNKWVYDIYWHYMC